MYRRLLVAIVALVVLAGCGGTAASTGSYSEATSAAASAPQAAAPVGGEAAVPVEAASADDGTTGSTSNPDTTSPANATQFGRMVIRTAQLSLLVDDTDATEAKVRDLVQTMGGYVLASQTNGDEEQRSVSLTFKVPAERFDEALNNLAHFATKVQNRNVTGEDVTDQFVDTEARLRTLRATEARLLEFLKAAKTTEEALQVNEQLTNLQGEIEQASGRIQLLKQSTSFSTITVNMQPNILLAFSSDESWSPGMVARQSWQNLVQFTQGIADIAIAFAIWLPVWGTLLLIGLALWRRFGRGPVAPPTT
jgi:hypothetical protein